MEHLWQRVVGTVTAEFSDVPDATQVTRLLLRLAVAALLGGVLGYERERKGKAAGIRTHMLVSMGAALFVLVPQQAGVEPGDMTRVMQGLIAGIGFLGAGAIVKGRDEQDVQGLTTAAGIWMTAAIGVAAGLGRETTAILSTLLALVVLAIVPHVVVRFALEERKGNGSGDDAMTQSPDGTLQSFQGADPAGDDAQKQARDG